MNKRTMFIRLGRMSAMELRKGRYMRAPDHPAPTPPADPAAPPSAPPADGLAGLLDPSAPPPPATPPADPAAPWYGSLSDQGGEGGALSDRAWMDNKKFGDLAAMVKSTRELEGRFLSPDKIVLPKEGDAPEVFANFYKAIGRPDAADAYEIPVPEGAELDEGFASKIREAAFQAGVPAGMMKPLAEAFNAHIVELQQNAEAQAAEAKRAGVQEMRGEWGDKFTANVANANRAMKMLELDADQIGRIETGLGTADTLRLLARLGAGMGEDALIGGGGAKVFSVTPAEAQAELDNMNRDPGLRAKIIAKDATIVARRNMLMQVVAAEAERKRSA